MNNTVPGVPDTYPFALGAHGKKRFQLYFVQLVVVFLFKYPTLFDVLVSSESLTSPPLAKQRWFFFGARTAFRND